jgi:hypothetical protein
MFAELFPSNGCLCRLHSYGFQQTCYNIQDSALTLEELVLLKCWYLLQLFFLLLRVIKELCCLQKLQFIISSFSSAEELRVLFLKLQTRSVAKGTSGFLVARGWLKTSVAADHTRPPGTSQISQQNEYKPSFFGYPAGLEPKDIIAVCQTAQRYISEVHDHNIHCCENLRSQRLLLLFFIIFLIWNLMFLWL